MSTSSVSKASKTESNQKSEIEPTKTTTKVAKFAVKWSANLGVHWVCKKAGVITFTYLQSQGLPLPFSPNTMAEVVFGLPGSYATNQTMNQILDPEPEPEIPKNISKKIQEIVSSYSEKQAQELLYQKHLGIWCQADMNQCSRYAELIQKQLNSTK